MPGFARGAPVSYLDSGSRRGPFFLAVAARLILRVGFHRTAWDRVDDAALQGRSHESRLAVTRRHICRSISRILFKFLSVLVSIYFQVVVSNIF